MSLHLAPGPSLAWQVEEAALAIVSELGDWGRGATKDRPRESRSGRWEERGWKAEAVQIGQTKDGT